MPDFGGGLSSVAQSDMLSEHISDFGGSIIHCCGIGWGVYASGYDMFSVGGQCWR